MNTNTIIKSFLYITAASLILAGTSFAKSMDTIEGTIQGANCVIHKTVCPLNASDPHIALENDFVLVAGNGEYFFIPNLSRSLKEKYLNQKVRITGDKKEHTIVASNIDVKDQGKYQSVWNWASIVDEMRTGN